MGVPVGSGQRESKFATWRTIIRLYTLCAALPAAVSGAGTRIPGSVARSRYAVAARADTSGWRMLVKAI